MKKILFYVFCMCDNDYREFNFISCQYLYTIMLILYYYIILIKSLKNKKRRIERRKERTEKEE